MSISAALSPSHPPILPCRQGSVHVTVCRTRAGCLDHKHTLGATNERPSHPQLELCWPLGTLGGVSKAVRSRLQRQNKPAVTALARPSWFSSGL